MATKKRNTFHEDESLDQAFSAEQLKRLIGYILRYKKEVIIAISFILVSTAANLTLPMLMRIVIDDYVPNADVKSLVITGGIFLVVIGISTVSMKYRIHYMSRLGQNVVRDIRTDIFEHIQTLPFTFYDGRPHGKILVRVVNYVNSLSELLGNGFVQLVVDIFTFIIAFIIMLRLSPVITGIVSLYVPLTFLGIWIVKNKQRKAMQEVSMKQSNMNAYIHESISGIKVTQSFTREDVNAEVFDELMDDYQSKWMESRMYMGLIFPIVKNMSLLSQGTLLAVSLLFLKDSITAGMIVAALGYLGFFWMPLINISEFYNQMVAASAYLERIFETIDTEPEIKDAEDAYELPEITGRLHFDHIDFGYEEDQTILKDFDLEVEAGQSIALVGPTGAGKTTVVNLISRFYDVRSGALKVDGHDVREVTLHSLRDQMGIMMQDTFIFSGTIMDNIRYGKLDATDEEVIAAAKTVKAHDFIAEMQDGYETEVNERGSRLSTGQRQLISFARALLKDPKILILDEATSSIDTQTEKVIQESIDHLLEGRTSFVIAHRLSTIKKADKIIVINNMGIEEYGTHDELLETKGHYYDLYQAQVKFLQEATV